MVTMASMCSGTTSPSRDETAFVLSAELAWREMAEHGASTYIPPCDLVNDLSHLGDRWVLEGFGRHLGDMIIMEIANLSQNV